MPGHLDFEFRFHKPAPQPRGDTPMRILLLGDFSGRSNRGVTETLADRSLVSLDVDNFDERLARLAPCLELPTAGRLDFRELDDFHPDALYRRLELFQGLRDTRKRLANPNTFSQAAAELGPGLTPSPAPPEPAPENDAELFGRLLGKPTDRPAANIHSLLRSVVAPYLLPDTAGQEHYLVAVDQAIAEHLRRVLHHPDFQALEAAWRSAWELVSNLETGEELSVGLLDASRAELSADLEGTGGKLATSALFRRLTETDRSPWSLLVVDYTFGPDRESVRLLAGLGAVAAHAGGPLLAAADPSLAGCRSLAKTPDPTDWRALDLESDRRWQALRQSPVAPWLGLALPRVLLRLPYGARTDPVDSFDFEELASTEDHHAWLWGNPAFACARLLGAAFTDRGWAMNLQDRLDLEDLPAHSYEEHGETILKPCAEVVLGERAVAALLDRGLMPLLGSRRRNALRLACFRSLAEGDAALAGPWN